MRKKREEQYITITDVAKEAGVSIATVSRVINNGNVRDAKRRAVLDAIKKLNYVPNNSARNLAAVNATKRIMLMVPSITVPCYIDLIKGFKSGAHIYKYDPIIQDYDYDKNRYQELNNSLLASSEIKALVQIGEHQDIANKIVVGLDNELLEIKLDAKYENIDMGIYFPTDEILADFMQTKIFKKSKIVTNEKDLVMESYITQTIEDAAKLINMGVTKTIYVLDKTEEINQIVSNIKSFPIDFYAVGVVLAHIAIKNVTGIVDEKTKGLELIIK